MKKRALIIAAVALLAWGGYALLGRAPEAGDGG